MTDHLEPYRRMVRSIRFVPALGRNEQLSQQKANPVISPQVDYLPRTSLPLAKVTPAYRPSDPTQDVTALVRDAVEKPTVLPVTYAIPENIGDRISRLASPKAVTPAIIEPKIPQPDPNWVAPNAAAPQQIELDWRDLLENAQKDASAPVEVAAPAEQLEQTPQDLPEVEATAPVSEPEQLEQTPQDLPEVEATAPVSEPEQLEQTPQDLT